MRVPFLKTLCGSLVLCALFVSYESANAQGPILNADSGFDNFYNNADGTSGAWKPFKISSPGPNIWKHPTEGWPKGPSLWIYGDAIPFDGGVYQVVVVTPGHGYHFEVAWAVVRHGGVAVHDSSRLIRQVGIDPVGGTDPLSPNVQWSGEYAGSGKFAPELAIDQYARGNHITLFLRAKNNYADQRAEVFFDTATLTENPGMPPIVVAQPTPTYAPTATARIPATSSPVRTRVALATLSATPTNIPTATLMPAAMNTPAPTVTRTPRPMPVPTTIPTSAFELASLNLLALAGACGLGGMGILFVAGVAFLLLTHLRL
jgi:hypothetical protein